MDPTPLRSPLAVPTHSLSLSPVLVPETPTSTPFISKVLPSSSPTPSVSPSEILKLCECTGGHCFNGGCRNCLQIYGPNGSQKACFSGWTKFQCDTADSSYNWCGEGSTTTRKNVTHSSSPPVVVSTPTFSAVLYFSSPSPSQMAAM